MKKQRNINGSYNLVELTPWKKQDTLETISTLSDDEEDALTVKSDDSTYITEYFDPAITITKKDKKYNLISHEQDEKVAINPWSKKYIGIVISYISVGMMYGGTTSILYPILIIHEGVTSSLYTACISLVTIFWSYKIIFGMFSDVLPIFGYKRKSYMVLGWMVCASTLLYVSLSSNILSWKNLVLMFTIANMGYVLADVAADAFMVYIANNHETKDQKGNMQTLVYSCFYFGQVVINVILLFGFSGPEINCVGYQRNGDIECTDDVSVATRNEYYQDYPHDWCQ